MSERSLRHETLSGIKVARRSEVPVAGEAYEGAQRRGAHAWRVPPVTVKEGVVLDLAPPMVRVLPIIDALYLAKFGVGVTITSGREGSHAPRSLHYRGLAVDLRTRGFPLIKVRELSLELRSALGPSYDVVMESDHLHVEYDP